MTTGTFAILSETEACVLGTLSGVFRCLHKGQERAVKAVTIYKPGFAPKEGSPIPVRDKWQRAWIVHLESKPLASAESWDSALHYLNTSATAHA
jgi:hypothetical protein